jgi:tetratricopeptide (TPR) repeat protein
MALIYKVTVEPIENGNKFRIIWQDEEKELQDYFIVKSGLTAEDTNRLWRQPQHQLEVGRKLFRFLDGDSRYLQRALDEGYRRGEMLQLHIYARDQVADWPFELLAREEVFLLPHRLHLVRRISDWGEEKPMPPENRQIKMLFMACSAIDSKPELDFEREEEAIFSITKDLAIDMEVEDSGSLEGLRGKLVHERFDVVHLSGHAKIDKQGRPLFIMEQETGYPCEVSPEKLWKEALIENPPRLLFLSGCRTGEIPDTNAAASFAQILVEKYGLPAVLGWGRSVSDEQAIHAEKFLYYELSRGESILEAVQRVRIELIKRFQSNRLPAWPLLRLFSSGLSLNALVTKGQQGRFQPRRMLHTYLKNSNVQVLAEGFVGRRRQLQQSLRALKQGSEKIGVLLLGTAGLGKSCLAGKICERLTLHTLIIVHGILNTTTLLDALKDAFRLAQDKEGLELLSQKIKLPDPLADLCSTVFKKKNYLLLLDGFEQNLEGAKIGQPGVMFPEAGALLNVLFRYLPNSDNMTQMIITCRYEFTLTRQDRDQVSEKLEKVWLTGFQESETRKKAQELKNILNIEDRSVMQRLLAGGLGNPCLMEWLDRLVGRLKKEEVPQLPDTIISSQREDFVHRHLIDKLLHQGGDHLRAFLQGLAIYRRPVQAEGIGAIAKKAGLEGWKILLEKGKGLSLIEYDQARRTYRLTPLLRKELLSQPGDAPLYHKAAFEYYNKVYEGRKTFETILVEELIFQALGCGEEKTASEQGGRLVKHLRERLAFRESRRVGMWILKEKKQKLANEEDAFLLNETALTLKNLGDYQKAIEHYQLALVVDQLLFGPSHYTVARDLNNLGSAWRVLMSPEKAIEHYRKSLNIVDAEGFKDKHPDLAGTLLNNLGSLLLGMGDYNESVEYSRQALLIWKELFNEKHPNVAVTLNNLGAALLKSGNHSEAVENYREALTIDLSVFGRCHPDVATDLNNLGMAYLEQDDCENAIKYSEEALRIWENIYGSRHANFANALNNLGQIYIKMEQEEKAKRYFEKAYGIFKDLFGTQHKYTRAVAESLK